MPLYTMLLWPFQIVTVDNTMRQMHEKPLFIIFPIPPPPYRMGLGFFERVVLKKKEDFFLSPDAMDLFDV